jgi:predicted DNA-binding transcriptional regulator YafY
MNYPKNDHTKVGARKQMHYSPNLLDCIQNAIDHSKLTVIEYESRESDVTSRTVEPMALVYKNRKRHLVAWCQLREDWRTFRLDRIEMVKIMTESFEKRAGFNVADFEKDDDFTSSDENFDEEDENDEY